MFNKKILFVDTETGGINPKEHSLLSIGAAVWENNKITATKEWLIKHKTFNITSEAISINKLNLLEFIKNSSEPSMVLNELIEFLNHNFSEDIPITIGGHNINFDVNFIKAFFTEHNIDFYKYFSHRFIDTASILKYLYYAEIIPEDLSSSDKAFKYFNIKVKKRHSALGDAVGTAELFSKLVKLIQLRDQTMK